MPIHISRTTILFNWIEKKASEDNTLGLQLYIINLPLKIPDSPWNTSPIRILRGFFFCTFLDAFHSNTPWLVYF